MAVPLGNRLGAAERDPKRLALQSQAFFVESRRYHHDAARLAVTIVRICKNGDLRDQIQKCKHFQNGHVPRLPLLGIKKEIFTQ